MVQIILGNLKCDIGIAEQRQDWDRDICQLLLVHCMSVSQSVSVHWGYIDHSNPYIHSTTVLCDIV